jgi:hypothetical protein
MVREMSSMSITFKMAGTMANVLNDASSPSVQHPSLNFRKTTSTLENGINSNQANRAWQSENRTLTAAASETLDIYDLAAQDIGAGAGLDGVGQAIVFEEIVGIAIVNENDVDAAGALEIEAAAANGWTAIGDHTVANGGALYGQGVLIKLQLDTNGFDVVDASNHRLTFTATGGPVTYSIYLLGRHDDEESSSSSSSSSPSSVSSGSSSSASSSSSSSQSSSSSSTSSPSSTSSVTSSSFSEHSSSSSSSSSSATSSSSSGTSSSSATSSFSSQSSSSWSLP